MVTYNKAVRDKIPQIIKKSGFDYNVKKLDNKEFLVELEKKLDEELKEYQQSKSVEELADILEVILRISELRGIAPEELEKLRLKKADERGKFTDNLFLIDTSKIEHSNQT